MHFANTFPSPTLEPNSGGGRRTTLLSPPPTHPELLPLVRSFQPLSSEEGGLNNENMPKKVEITTEH